MLAFHPLWGQVVRGYWVSAILQFREQTQLGIVRKVIINKKIKIKQIIIIIIITTTMIIAIMIIIIIIIIITITIRVAVTIIMMI